MNTFFQDFRYAFRQLRRSPGFFSAAATLIALGIAANTLLFALADALLFRPLPIRDPHNLVQLFETRSKQPASPYFDYGFYNLLASSSAALFDVVGQMETTRALERGTGADRVHAHAVTDNFFSNLGVRLLLGRGISQPDSHVAVLSYGYWARSFGHDTKVLGQTVRLQGYQYTIIGVTPEEFAGTTVDSSPDLWIPYANLRDFSRIPNSNLSLYAIEIVTRLRPGVSAKQAQQETSALWTRYMDDVLQSDPANGRKVSGSKLEVRSISNGVSSLRDQSGTALLLLLTGAGLLLLMVCANVGGLLLARSTGREKEIAVRLALGAGQGRLFRQWLTESLLLTAVGGFTGVMAAYATLPLLMRWMPPARGVGFDPAEIRILTLHPHLNFRVMAFSLCCCVLTVVLCAFVPAWQSRRPNLTLALKRTMSDTRNRVFQSVLCGFQVAVCTLLLISAGLMIRTLSHLESSDAGVDRDHVTVFSIDPHVRAYDAQKTWALQRRLIEGAKRLPGVDGAAIAGRALMRGIGLGISVVFPGQRVDGVINTSVNSVTPGYFTVMGIKLVAGRDFRDVDVAETQTIAKVVVNEAFARKFLNGEDALGKQFGTGKQFVKAEYEIIGVVTDAKYRSLREEPPPIFYTNPFGPKGYPDAFILHVHSSGDARTVIQPVRELLHSIDPEVPLYQVATLSEEVDRSLWQEHLMVALTSSFGIFALSISAIGIYGVLAYFVVRRQHEIGIRMALGARLGHVIWLVIRRVVPILSIGMFAGAGLSWMASNGLKHFLYGVEPFDPWAISIPVLLLLAIALLGAAVPTIRAIAVDPSSTLRQE